jgi:putative FmdB family regulatory protein
MPTYEYFCPEHGHFERFLPFSEWNVPQKCECGLESRKLISSPMVHVRPDVCYDSPIDGKPITSWKQREEDMKRANCVEYDPGIKQDYQRRIADSERNLDRIVDQTVEEAIEKMPVRKKEQLTSELESGANAEVVRQ